MNTAKWKGQFKREWILMKSNIIVYAILNLVVVLGGGFFINTILEPSDDWFEALLIIAGIWLVVGVLLGCGILFISLEREMKEPDIWLHSSSTMVELASVKIAFATLMAGLLVLWGQLIIVTAYFMSDVTLTISEIEGLLILIIVFLAIILNGIFITSVGFFFWAIYRIFQARTKTYGFVIAFGLFLGTSYFWGKVRVLGLFNALANIMPFHVADESFYSESANFFFVSIISDSVVNSGGSLLFYGFLSIFLIWLGALLFDQKVRL